MREKNLISKVEYCVARESGGSGVTGWGDYRAESDLAIAAEKAQLDAIQMDSLTLAEYQRIGKKYIEEEITVTE